ALPFSSLALITIFSKVYDVVVSRDITFEYTDVASLFIEAKKYSDITNWLVENNAKKLFLDFAKKIEKKGNDIFAKKIYTLSLAQF
ncbi:MAG: hypothetical protein IKI31_03755, partial [Treponema sp.]|nr:hypothetical protein [Treponema sp.]